MNKIQTTILFTFFSISLFGQFSPENIIFQNELNNPSSIQLADFDDDGDPDIISAIQNSNQVIWYRNEGQGVYSDFMVLIDDIEEVTSAFAIDIDNDGDLDMLTTRIYSTSNRLAWYENTDGQGTYSDENLIGGSDDPYTAIAIKDIDGDGDVDIVSTKFGYQLHIFLNVDGAGDFSQTVYLNDNGSFADIQAVEINDLDGDGDNDIIYSRGNQKEISWFENTDGAGTFGDKKVAYAGSSTNWYELLLSKDIDGDGDNDILFYNPYENITIGWLENLDGQGNFSGQNLISGEFFSRVLYLEDMDLDGDLDVLTTAHHNLVWFENTNGQGQYSSENVIPLLIENPYTIGVGDLDTDGDLDLITHSFSDNEIAWMENDGTTNFNIKNTFFTGINGGIEVQTYDLDGDNDLDILFGSIFNGKIIWQENIDGEANILESHVITTDGDEIRDIAAADLDGDGDLDVYAGSWSLGETKIMWYENLDGLGNFSDEIILTENLSRVNSVHAADIDGDGDLDMLGGAWVIDGLNVYKNTDGLGNFDTGTEISNITKVSCIQTFDIDVDGDLDIVACFYSTDQIIWFENTNGNGDFGTGTVISNTADGAQFVHPADLDLDGDLDLIVANSVGNEIVWFENQDGVGTFGVAQIISTDVDSPKSAIGFDLDGDGDLDILSASTFDDKISWFENLNGQGDFGSAILIDNDFDGAYYATAGDIDSDGDLDVLAAALNGDKISLYKNNINNALIKGQVFWDENENGILDNMEVGLNQQLVSLQPTSNSWSSGLGLFNFLVTDGNYDLTCTPTDGWEFTTDATVSINYSSANGVLVQNFGLKADQAISAATIDLTSAPTRCGFEVPFWINYDDTGNQNVNGVITLNLDDLVTYQNAEPMPNQINGNELVWNISDLPPTYNDKIYLFLEMPDVNSLGETITMESTIDLTDVNGNIISTSNHQFESVINCAYDPNDKLVEPNFEDYDNYTLFGDTLIYTIRFQNTGTDTAFNIRLEDQLDIDLDWSTFTPLVGSHPFEVYLDDNGKLKFYFNDILLPDVNTNEPESHGFVKYQILPKANLSENTIIDNMAEIYFDFNPPILTNVTSNIMVLEYPIDVDILAPLCFGGGDGSISLNFPFGDEFNYVWDNGSTEINLVGLPGGAYTVTVTDEYGQVVADSTFTIVAPSEIELTTSSMGTTTLGSMDGSATVVPTGGTSPYTYSWNTQPIQMMSTATNLTPDTYQVTVTDFNGCTQIAEVIVDVMSSTKDLLLDWKYDVSPNPSLGSVKVTFDFLENKKWKIKVFNSIGSLVQKIEAPNQGTQKGEYWINNLISGIYHVSLEADHQIQVKKIVVVSK